MAPLRSLGNIRSAFDDFYARTGKDAVNPSPLPIISSGGTKIEDGNKTRIYLNELSVVFLICNNKPFIFLAFFMALFVTASNFLVQYPINFFGMEEFLTYGAFTYPVTFLITDLSNRRYGKFVARKIVYMGFI